MYLGWQLGRVKLTVSDFYVFLFGFGLAADVVFGFVCAKHRWNVVDASKIGVWGLSLVSVKSNSEAANRAFKNGAWVGFDSGAAMLYNIKAPLLNARTVRAQNVISHLIMYVTATQNGGGNGYGYSYCQVQAWIWTPFLHRWSKNLAPKLKLAACIHIYSCGVIIWSKFGVFKCYYLVQVCFL